LRLLLAHTGSYPRIGDGGELQALRRTIAGLDRGERAPGDVAAAEDEMTRRALEEQARAGIELVTDGQIRWNDPVSHLAGKMENVRVNGLLRFFDTNFYFRQPVLAGRPACRGPLVVEEYRFAQQALAGLSDGRSAALKVTPVLTGERHLVAEAAIVPAAAPKLKAVLTGPYTLARLSLVEDGASSRLEDRVLAYAEILSAEARALEEAGAEFIQVDEPAILLHPDDWAIFSEGLVRVAQGKGKARLALYVYFHDCVRLYEKLAALPVDVLGLDFSYNPELVGVVATSGAPRPLGLGLVDGRNTMLEKPESVARQLERMLPKIAGEESYLGPSCGLEYLPRDRAFAKLELLGKIRAALGG
jgi:5-methyltetrahydropteroyltriglutamate--homocysteine methyltransferase